MVVKDLRYFLRNPRALAVFLAGVVAVGLSLLPGPGIDDTWTRDLLMTVGSSAVLFAVFYFVTRALDEHLDRVEQQTAETAQQVEEVRADAAETVSAVTAQVDALRADVDQRMEDMFVRIAASLDADAAADEAAFEALRTTPTRQAVWEAMTRAISLGLVLESRPPRVRVSTQTPLYVSVAVDLHEWADHPLSLRVENIAGYTQAELPWPDDAPEEETAEAVLREVGREVRKHANEMFDPKTLFEGLADLLEAANSHAERRPAVELCPPQWLVCERRIVAYDRTYDVSVDRMRAAPSLVQSVAEKPWCDRTSWTGHRR